MTATVANLFGLPQPIHGGHLPAGGWRRTSCRIRTKEGPVVVSAWEHPSAPGLAYHRVHGVREIAHTVTHKESGLRCGPICLSHAEARAVLGDLAARLDWTTPEAVVARTPEYRDRSHYVALVYSDSLPPWFEEEDHL